MYSVYLRAPQQPQLLDMAALLMPSSLDIFGEPSTFCSQYHIFGLGPSAFVLPPPLRIIFCSILRIYLHGHLHTAPLLMHVLNSPPQETSSGLTLAVPHSEPICRRSTLLKIRWPVLDGALIQQFPHVLELQRLG